ncbi:hypothetical protein HGA03_02360 [Cellulomonas denverensis]|uniref:Nucleotidyltransferase n=1 Tax=Cellulomonas denverensis TaxID=264297 RepID=A0A7X6QXW5_9CELL|nr:hypothetical protein [Cellulomonas denverensis]NKY21504.1 hypothetical protein [Cellulomonas denverensis]
MDVVTTLTTIDAGTTRATLTSDHDPGVHTAAGSILANLVRQAPATHDDRVRLLAALSGADHYAIGSTLHAAAEILRRYPPRFPATIEAVELPALDPILTETFAVVQALDGVAQPWTVVGGLMVLLQAVEHGVPFRRVTADADLAVGVFTHRSALRELSRGLRDLGFADITPDAMSGDQLSYRWSRGAVLIDLVVPAKVNTQRTVPTTMSRHPAVELPGIQQALARTERVTVVLDDGRAGPVRRPDLLGALTIKAIAARADRRDPARHLGDMIVLLDALVASGQVMTYAPQVRPEDRARLAGASTSLTESDWRSSMDEPAARDALDLLISPDA